MKKTYIKPVATKREKLEKITAIVKKPISAALTSQQFIGTDVVVPLEIFIERSFERLRS